MRKLLVSALVLAMVLGFGGLAFGAPGSIAGPAFSDIAGHEAEGELTLLAALGAFTGDTGIGGTVRPDDPITRAEFSKIVVVGLGKGSTAASLSSLTPTFKDAIPTWAWGYVQCAQFMGIVGGYTDGTFRASNNVTYGEAVTMLVKGVFGHNAQVPPGVWPHNYVFYGIDANFTGGVEVGFASLPATRGDLARMLVATMQVDKVDKEGVAKADTSILFPKTVKGTFSAYALGTNPTVTLTGVSVPLGDPVHIIGTSHYASLVGLNVWAVKNADGKAVALWVKQTANSVKGVFKAYADENTTIPGNDTYLLVDGTKLPIAGAVVDDASIPPVKVFDPSTLVTVNGGMQNEEPISLVLPLLKAGDECTFVLGSDAKAANVTVLRFDLPKCYISDKVTKSTAAEDTQIAVSGAGNYEVTKTAAITINGGTADRDTLAQYDVLFVASKLGDGPGTYHVDINPIFAIRGSRQSIEATVKSSRTVFAGGTDITYYTTFEFADKSTKEYVVLVLATGGNIPAGGLTSGSGKFGLDANGKVYIRIAYETTTPYVLVKSYSSGTAGKFVTVDMRGTEVTYEVDSTFVFVAGDMNKLGVLTFDAFGNVVLTFTAYTIVPVPAAKYDIVGVDPNNNITLLPAGLLTPATFVPGAAVYKYDLSEDEYTYLPASQVGLWKSNLTGTFVLVSGSLIVYYVP